MDRYFLLREATEYFGSPLDNYQFTLAGLTVENRVEYSGYDRIGGYLHPIEGEEQTFVQQFSIRVE